MTVKPTPPAPVANGEYSDAYQGAREDLSIWKRRALEAEGEARRLGKINDYLVKQAQGESRFGEPVIREPALVAVHGVVGKLLNILDRHTVELGWGEKPITLAELVISRDGPEELDSCRAAMQAEPVSHRCTLPDGWKLVPIEPTAEMLTALYRLGSRLTRKYEVDLYSAMLAVAPTAPLTGYFRENGNSSTENFREITETSTKLPEKCWCRTCRPSSLTDMRFVVCPDCGNKRCPHANDHRNACSGSNKPGQAGSAYPAAPEQEV